MTKHIVTGPAVVLPTDDGSERYLYRGAIIGNGFTKAGLKHALELGLIDEVEEIVIGDDTAVIVAAEAAFEERVQVAAQQIVTEQIAPEFDKRVEAKAEELLAARAETPPPAATTPAATPSPAPKTTATKTTVK